MFAHRRFNGKSITSIFVRLVKKQLLIFFLILTNVTAYTQDTLPSFKASGFDKNILITWRNTFDKQIENINIQRSYDSLRHFSTIGTVFNPQSEENGYTDYNPPYSRMYYRIFVGFKDGTYIITTPKKPIWLPAETPEEEQMESEVEEEPLNPDEPGKVPVEDVPISTDKTKTESDKEVAKVDEPKPFRPAKREPWRADPLDRDKEIKSEIKEKEKEVIRYPSKRIYVYADHQIVLNLPDAMIKDYSVKFFTLEGKMIFELKHLREEYLILEKMYFGKSGWYNFEIYDRGMLIEKNKLQVLPDKPRNGQLKRKP